MNLRRVSWTTRPDAWAMAFIVVIVLVANGPYLLDITDPNPLGPRSQVATSEPAPVIGANTLDPTDGYITQALGHLAATDVLHGRLPWWNPYEGAGMPLVAEGQSAALFPPTLLLAIDNGQFWEDLLLELVAGLSTFLVLRRLGSGRVASVAGGAGFALTGAFAWLATTSFNEIAFLPLLVLGIEHSFTAAAARRPGGWWLIAVALALSLYAGFPETAYIDGLVALIWFAWRCVCSGRPLIRGFLIKGLSGACAGLMIAAPFIVSFAAALPHENIGFHNGNAGALTMPEFAFPQLLLPYVYGPIAAFNDPQGVLGTVWGYAGGYVSIAVFFLAVLSLLSPRLRGLKLVLVAWLLLVICRVYGVPVIGHVLLLLPGGTSVAFYRYSFPAIAFALVVLGAFGIDDVVAGTVDRRAIAAAAAGMLIVLAALAIDAHRLVVRLDGGASHSRWAWGQIAWATVTIVGITAAALWRGRLRYWVAAAFVVLDAGGTFMLHELSAPGSVRRDPAPVAFLQRHLGNGRFFTLGPLAPNYGAYYGIASLNDIDLPLPQRWTTYVNAHLDKYVNPVFFVGDLGGGRSTAVPSPEHELLANLDSYRAADVRYVVTAPGERLPTDTGRFSLLLQTPTAWIYRVAGAVPYYTTRSRCAIAPRGLDIVKVSCAQPTTLVRRELDFPGWSATVDGRSTPIRTGGGIYQSIDIPSGTHTVSFGYSPPGIGWALLGLLVGLGWTLLGAVTDFVVVRRWIPRLPEPDAAP